MSSYVLSAKVIAQLDPSSVQNTRTQLEKASSVKGSVDLTISPQAARALKDLRDSMDAVVAATGKLNSSGSLSGIQTGTARVTAATRAQSQLAAQVRATSKELTTAGDSMEQFGRRAGLAASRFVAFTAAAGPIVGVAAAIRAGITEAIKFDLELNKLKQVSGDTASRIGEIRDEVTRLSTSLGVSSTELAGAATTIKQAGLSARETKELLEGVAKASLAPNFKDIKEITEGAIAAYQQFGKSAKETKEILGAINAVAGDFATEASDLVTALQKAGGAFSVTGGKANELIALMAAVRSTTRESADSIATGLRTIFTRLQRDDTTNALKALQVNLRYTREEARALGDENLADQFVGAYEAIRRVSEGLSGLRSTDSRFSAAIESLGGYRQVSRVVPLIQQFTEAQKALNVAKIGSLSIDQAAETRQAAVETRINKMRESFQKFFNTLVQSDGFNALINSLSKIADAMSRVLEVAGPLLPIIAGIAGAKFATSIPSLATGLLTPHQYQSQGYTAPPPSSRYIAKKFSAGGRVPGSGSGDTVPAMLEPREFVIRKDAVEKIGVPALRHINQTGKLPGYASGGVVGGYAAGDLVSKLNPDELIKLYGLDAKFLRNPSGFSIGGGKSVTSGAVQSAIAKLGEKAESVLADALIKGLESFDPDRIEGGIKKGELFTKAKSHINAVLGQEVIRVSKLKETTAGYGGDATEVLGAIASKETIPESNYKASEILDAPGVKKGSIGLAALKATVLAAKDEGFKTPEKYIRKRLRYEDRDKADKLMDLLTSSRELSSAQNIPLEQFLEQANADTFKDIKSVSSSAKNGAISPLLVPHFLEYDPHRSDRFLKSGRTRSGNRVDAYPGLEKLYRSSGYVDVLIDELRENTGAALAGRPGRRYFQGGGSYTPPGLFGSPGGFVPHGPSLPPDFPNNPSATIYSARGGPQLALPPHVATVSPPIVRSYAARPIPDQFADLAAADRAALSEYRTESGITSARGSSYDRARRVSALNAAGGADQLSLRTIGEIEQREHNRSLSDLTKGIQRQLNALYPTISATESYRKAQELAAAAVKEGSGERVLRNRGTGNVIGLESLGLQLDTAGRPIEGRATGIGGRLRGGFQKLKEAFRPDGSQVGYFAAAATLGALGGFISPSQAEADSVARSGSGGGRYKAEAAASGILAGAAGGAGIGLATGNPAVIAIGAAAGAAIGLYSSLKEASRALDEARLGQKLNEFGDFLERVGRKGSGITAGGEGSALESLTAARGLVTQKVDRESGGYLFGALPGLNDKERSALLQNTLRESFGGQLGGLVQLLNNRAEAVGRRSPRGDVGSLTGDFATGLNKEMLQLVADIRNVPVAEVLKDFVDVIKAAQISAKNSNLVDLGRRQQERIINEGTRLSSAFDNAAVAASKFEQNLSLVGEGAVKFNSLATGFGQGGAANRSEFNSSLGILSKVLGPQIGPGFAAQASANGRVSALLPDVLSTLQNGNLSGEQSVGEQVRALLGKQLGPGLSSNPALGRAVDLAVGGITALADKPADFAKRLETDLTKVVEEVVKLFDGPLKEAGERMAKALDEEAQTFSERLAHARQIAAQADEFSGRSAEARLTASKYAASLAETRTGVSAASQLSLAQLQQPFVARQFRLAGANGLDPNALSARLAAIQTRLPAAADAAAAARGDKTKFAAAATELDKLRGEASNLQQALRNLADSGNRTAAIQEKLGELSNSRDSRRGFAEHYLFAGADERASLQRGQLLIGSTLGNRNNFLNFTNEEQQTTLKTLGSLGRSRLAGGVRADLLKNQLLDVALSANGGAGALSPQDADEERQLQAENAKALEDAATALDKLSEFTRSENTRFIDNLKAAHDQFFDRLATNLAAEIVNASRNTLSAAQEEKRRLGESGKYAGVLSQAGITTDAQTKALLNSKESIGTYIQLTRQIQELSFTGGSNNPKIGAAANKYAREITDQQSRYTNQAMFTEGIERSLGNSDLKARDEAIRRFVAESDAARNLGGASQDLVFQKVRDKFGDVLPSNSVGGTQEQRTAIAEVALKKLLTESVREVTSGQLAELSNRRAEAGRELDRQNLPFDAKRLGSLPPASQDLLFKAAEHFDGVSNKLDELGKAFDRNREKIDAATSAYGAVQGGAVGRANGGWIYRSAGGSAFRPRGTDVIPAMLSPGEFVVNAQSARANSELLHIINQTRDSFPIPLAAPAGPRPPASPGYYASGGVVDPEQAERDELERRYAAQKAQEAIDAARPPQRDYADFGGFDAAKFRQEQEAKAAAAAVPAQQANAVPNAGVIGAANALAGVDPFGELNLNGRQRQLGAGGLLAAHNAGNVNSFLRQQAALRGAFLPGEDIQAMNAAAGFESARLFNDQRFRDRFTPDRLFAIQNQAKADVVARRAEAQARRDAIREARKNAAEALRRPKSYEVAEYSRSEPTPSEIAKEDLRKYKEEYNDRKLTEARRDRLNKEYGVRGFALGGYVGGYGTGDSVPARLSPGEFVLNKQAVQSAGLANLSAANAGVQPGGGGSAGNDQLARALLDFGTKSDVVASALRLFNTGADTLSKALDNFPREVQHNGRFEVVVTHVGGEVFQSLESSVAQMVDRKVNEVVNAEFERRVPDAPRPISG